MPKKCRVVLYDKLATGQSSRPGAHQQQIQTIAENVHISSLPLSTHSFMTLRYIGLNLLLTLTLTRGNNTEGYKNVTLSFLR